MLRYGATEFRFDYDQSRFRLLGDAAQARPLSDPEIGERFDNPIDSQPLEEIVQPGETVLFVVPDATREVAAGLMVNLLVRRLIAGGVAPGNIRIIFAVGIHRPVTETEERAILSPFVAQRFKLLEHNSRDLAQIARFGETSHGIPIELNRAVAEYDHVVLVGGITFHYFAGFTGGRKLVCPGLGSSRTISETHKLAFDCERKTRREGVGTGILDGNRVHEAFSEVVEKINPSFSINSIVNDKGEPTAVFAGDWRTAHRAACDYYAEKYSLEIPEKREVVIVSCGGAPHDVNMIQAHKAFDMASRACTPGGAIIFLARCADGLGRNDFLKWFDAENSKALAETLCANYQVNGQTAWSLLKKAENFDVQIVTDLTEDQTSRMRLKKVNSFDEALAGIDENAKGYIMPFGAKFLVKI